VVTPGAGGGCAWGAWLLGTAGLAWPLGTAGLAGLLGTAGLAGPLGTAGLAGLTVAPVAPALPVARGVTGGLPGDAACVPPGELHAVITQRPARNPAAHSLRITRSLLRAGRTGPDGWEKCKDRLLRVFSSAAAFRIRRWCQVTFTRLA
jgi:hypothetical protein